MEALREEQIKQIKQLEKELNDLMREFEKLCADISSMVKGNLSDEIAQLKAEMQSLQVERKRLRGDLSMTDETPTRQTLH